MPDDAPFIRGYDFAPPASSSSSSSDAKNGAKTGKSGGGICYETLLDSLSQEQNDRRVLHDRGRNRGRFHQVPREDVHWGFRAERRRLARERIEQNRELVSPER